MGVPFFFGVVCDWGVAIKMKHEILRDCGAKKYWLEQKSCGS
jgi:hypothetical protein